MAASEFAEEPSLTERRIRATLSVARAHGTPVPIADLADLLPPEGPQSPEELRSWLSTHPAYRPLMEYIDREPSLDAVGPDARRERGERFTREAEWVARVVLHPVSGLVRCFGISGSTAYGLPGRGDDLDFFAVVRNGTVWPFLLFAYLAARFRRVPSEDGPREWCFNFIVDEAAAHRLYAIPRGFLVAREALMMRPLLGSDYYRSLLQAASWVREELPRLYARVEGNAGGGTSRSKPAPLPVRISNLLLFPWMAAYLHLVTLVENRRFRRDGAGDRCFRVVPRLGGLTVESARFESLGAICRSADAHGPSAGPA